MKNDQLIPIKPKSIAPPRTVPKMSKADIINAMVERARRKHKQAKEEYESRKAEIMSRVEKAVAYFILENIKSLSIEVEEPGEEYVIGSKPNKPNKFIGFKGAVTSPLIADLSKEFFENEKTDPGWFQSDKNRDMIKQSMDNTEDKVNLILAQPENVETIDKLLQKIFTEKK